MRTEARIVVGSALAGLLLWVLDAAIEHQLARSGTFFGALLAEAPAHRIAMRVIVAVTLVVLGTVIASEITRRRGATRELDRLSHRLDLILNSAAEGIMGLDGRGWITFANPAAARLLGHSVAELVDRPHHSVLHYRRADGSDYPEAACPILAACTRGQPREVADEVFWRRDDTPLPVRYHCAPMYDGDELVGATLLFEEIREAERAERELQKLRHLSQLILSWAGEGIFGLDLQGRFTFANPAAGVMLGYDPEELVGRPAPALIRPDHAQGVAEETDLSLITAAYQDGDVYHVSEETFWRSDGQSFLAEYTSTPLREDGEIVGAVVVFKDVTERKLAEQNLRHTLDELARSNQALEQFAYVASHDLQEPLRMVTAYMDLLSRRYADGLDQDAREFIGYAVDGARRMQRLIEDLLEYSRVGTRGREPEPVAVDRAVDEALANLRAAVEESGAQISRDELPTVRADHTQLVQVYQNLIGNALKFRGEEPPRIHLSAARDGEMWELSVADNGIGIAPEQNYRIFAIFQRLHPAGEFPGTGIGLAVCRRIVERHGGEIWVDSRPGEGATFRFTIPATSDGAPARAAS